MSKNNTPKNIGGFRMKGELNEQGAKSRANAIIRLKEAWGVSELMDIFPREIKPKDDLGSTTITNLRTISNLCPDLKKAQNGMLSICKNPDGSYKTFSFSQSKSLVDRLKEMKSMLSASTPNTPATYDSSAASPSPVKAKQAKKDRAQAAGQELLLSVGKASVESTAAAEDEEELSITVDTAPKPKAKKKGRASLLQDKPPPTPPATMVATAPVAVMSTARSQTPAMASKVHVAVMSMEGSQAPGSEAGSPLRLDHPERPPPTTMVPTAAVAAMATDGSQAAGLKANPLKKRWINTAGDDSDSEGSGADDEDTGFATRALNVMNGIAAPTKVADNGWSKKAAKPATSRFAAEPTTIGRMVVPSKDLEHPFSKRKQKRSEQSETSNPPTDKPVNKPVQNKKPFTNLMSMAPNKPKTFEPPKRRIQKAGDTKKGVEMEQPKTATENVAGMGTQAELGLQNINSSFEGQPAMATPQGSTQGSGATTKLGQVEENLKNQVKGHFNKETQHDARIAPAEVNNDTTMAMGDAQATEAPLPTPKTARTQLPGSPQKKRTASTMLRAADEPNPQVERSIRARLEKLAAPYSCERVIADVLQFEHAVITRAEPAIEALAAGRNGGDSKAEDTKAEYVTFLTEFNAIVGKFKGRLLEIAEMEE